jgi:hypothetical protein
MPRRLGDAMALDLITPEAGAIYVMDRGYVDFQRLYVIHQAGAFYRVPSPGRHAFLDAGSPAPFASAVGVLRRLPGRALGFLARRFLLFGVQFLGHRQRPHLGIVPMPSSSRALVVSNLPPRALSSGRSTRSKMRHTHSLHKSEQRRRLFSGTFALSPMLARGRG